MNASSVPMDVVRQATTRCPPATHILAELPYLPSAVPQARHVLREGLRMSDIPEDVRNTAELLVSELVTNAVKYGEPPLWLFIEMRPGLIHASVSDTSTVLPQRRTAAADAEGGRGLLVLDALAGSWGTVAAETGKYLWFDLPVPPAPTAARTTQEAAQDSSRAAPAPASDPAAATASEPAPRRAAGVVPAPASTPTEPESPPRSGPASIPLTSRGTSSTRGHSSARGALAVSLTRAGSAHPSRGAAREAQDTHEALSLRDVQNVRERQGPRDAGDGRRLPDAHGASGQTGPTIVTRLL
ncbi:conserved hypothetical protein [Frankia sp. AiPs1]|uniref:ATP-binding protein n=1 Tax=Frankia sp. AiPa1 TaxID=573492 RepID=UPI00202B9577|nr:ATP-binding protein [Frankia sp. AiPa1]MCL9759356.1 ATP-binding protein [Frankia sp. AiPa1]